MTPGSTRARRQSSPSPVVPSSALRCRCWPGPAPSSPRRAPRRRRTAPRASRPRRRVLGAQCPQCAVKAVFPSSEGGDGLLVRRVVDRGQAAAGLTGLAREAARPGTCRRRAARTSRRSGSAKSQAGRRPATRSGQPSASEIGSRMSGGLACASVEPSANVTIEWIDRLRVHHHVDPLVGHAEQQVGLDQLEALVDQGRRVDRDHRPHVPGRVRHRCSAHRDVGQVRAPPAAERAARGGQHQPVDLVRRCRRAGTARSPSARSRPARAGPASPRAAPAGRPRSATPCWPARASRRSRGRASVGSRPRDPVMRVEHDVGSVVRTSSVTASGPVSTPGRSSDAAARRIRDCDVTTRRSARICSASSSTFPPPAARPTTGTCPGWRR